jgi:hypothetical protein
MQALIIRSDCAQLHAVSASIFANLACFGFCVKISDHSLCVCLDLMHALYADATVQQGFAATAVVSS